MRPVLTPWKIDLSPDVALVSSGATMKRVGWFESQHLIRLAVFLALLPALAACKKAEGPAQGGAPAGKGGGGFAIQVVAVPVRQQPVVESIGLVGSVTANEFVDIKAEADGTVLDIQFAEGQRVEKGAVLVLLDEAKARASLVEAEANHKLSISRYERAAQMLKEKLIPQQEYDQAFAALSVSEATVSLRQRLLRDMKILAPFAGFTGSRQISPGQVISRATPLTSVVDLDTVKIEVNVPERYLSQMRVGQALNFRVAAFPGESFRGEVYFISPQLDINTRTVLVKAKVPNPETKLRGGMFASLDLSLRLREAALVIPEPALMNNGDRVLVFVVDDAGKAQMRPIQVGVRLAGFAEVTQGLKEGENVVVEGVQKLAPGMPVKLAPPEAAAPYKAH